MQLENRSRCSICGGKCCKKCGCELSSKDFERIDIDYLQSKLDEGFVTITCDVIATPYNPKTILLYMRMRNIKSPKINLAPALNYPCASLTPDGCSYDFSHRPSGGRYLIPKENMECNEYAVPEDTFVRSWLPYQPILRELVIRNTGLTPEQRLSEEVEEGFYQCFDAFQKGQPYLVATFLNDINPESFKDEFLKAQTRYAKDHNLTRIKPNS